MIRYWRSLFKRSSPTRTLAEQESLANAKVSARGHYKIAHMEIIGLRIRTLYVSYIVSYRTEVENRHFRSLYFDCRLLVLVKVWIEERIAVST